jgi:MFS family permease
MTSRRRYLVLAICCMSLFIVGMDATIVNVALPSIGRDFHTSVSGLQWTVDAYALVIASLLMLSGSVADRVGRRMVFQAGLAIFTLGSLACSVAPGLGALVGFRALQAVGGSMLNPVAMSIITNTFTDPKDGPGRSASGGRRSACRSRPARSSAAPWSTRSAGAACSG